VLIHLFKKCSLNRFKGKLHGPCRDFSIGRRRIPAHCYEIRTKGQNLYHYMHVISMHISQFATLLNIFAYVSSDTFCNVSPNVLSVAHFSNFTAGFAGTSRLHSCVKTVFRRSVRANQKRANGRQHSHAGETGNVIQFRWKEMFQ